MRLTGSTNLIRIPKFGRQVLLDRGPWQMSAVRVAFPYAFAHHLCAERWCDDNLGDNGVRTWVETVRSAFGDKEVRQYAVDASARWFCFQNTIFIADQVDATAFKLRFG